MRFLLAVGALAVAVSSLAAQPALMARGQYKVGVKTMQLEYGQRKLTLEVWYPAKTDTLEQIVYRSTVGDTPYALAGKAGRDATALDGTFPMLIYSHGQPGARFQAAYLLEHLASQGFVVAAIDHADATYADLKQESYVSGLVNRPLDILAVLNDLPKKLPNADGNNVGLIGYSYGGYSSLNAAGLGLDSATLKAYCQQSNNEGPCFVLPYFAALEAARGTQISLDPRIKAVMVFAPYGIPWLSAKMIADMKVPLFVGVGSADTVATASRDAFSLFKQSGSSQKYLLTLEAATHNPWIVCPPEVKVNAKDYERCSEPNWDHAVSHGLAQHFATAFFALQMQKNTVMRQYLTPSLEGVSDKNRVKLETR